MAGWSQGDMVAGGGGTGVTPTNGLSHPPTSLAQPAESLPGEAGQGPSGLQQSWEEQGGFV